jgi:predicted RNA binding protein YcfA (HicA-like mRNA interferase family)
VSRLPGVPGREVVIALKKIGYEQDHQRGTKPPFRRIVVPNHDEIAKGTLRTIIREAGLTVGEFKSLL